ncbi:MAG: cell division protein FtsZ [Anaerolineales bacterium]|nr:cell division protein FtsZ [Anaerolineales bacterium]
MDETRPIRVRAALKPGPSTEDFSQIGKPRITVLGLGGGGSNAVNRMIELGLTGIDFIAANTDHQALDKSLAETRIRLGPTITRGLGAGGDPKIGAAAAMESSREIAAALKGSDMVFITAGMGGGTGTGAAPVAAEIARETGAVVIAVVTTPFTFEMARRERNASEGIRKLRPHTNTLITIPNDRLLQIIPQNLSLEVAFRVADDVLRQGVQGIAELVTQPGLINVDFAHVREIMQRGGGAFMSIGLGEGPQKSVSAIQQALHHPLLTIDSLDQAQGVLVHFTGGDDLSLIEVGDAVLELRKAVAPDADLILGASNNPDMQNRTQVILIITGIGAQPVRNILSSSSKTARENLPVPEHILSTDDIDVPTFLRRRALMSEMRE